MPGDVSNAVIASLARRPDVTTGTNGFAGFARGLSSGINVGQGWKSAREDMANRDDFEEVMGSRPPGPEPTSQQMGQGVSGKLGGFARAFLGGAGEEARGADPMFGLRQKLFEQNVQMADLKIQDHLQQRDEQIRNNAAYREFSDMMNGFISNGQAADPKSLGAMQTYLGRNPTLLKDPRTKDLITMYQAASKLQEAATQRQENKEFIAGALQNSPEGTFPQSANIESGSFSRGVLPKAANVSADLQAVDRITMLRKKIAAETDPIQKSMLETELADTLNKTAPANSSNEFFDLEGRLLMRTSTGRGQQQGGMTTALQTELQKKSMAADTALSKLNDALAAIQQNPQAIGVRGIAGEISEKAQGQLKPGEVMDTKITDTRHKAGLAFVEIAKSLRVDSGNMSRYELNQLENLGDLTGWDESAQTALAKGMNLKNALIGQKLRVNKELSKPNPDSLLKQIPKSEIKGMIINNLISEEDAVRWRKLVTQNPAQ